MFGLEKALRIRESALQALTNVPGCTPYSENHENHENHNNITFPSLQMLYMTPDAWQSKFLLIGPQINLLAPCGPVLCVQLIVFFTDSIRRQTLLRVRLELPHPRRIDSAVNYDMCRMHPLYQQTTSFHVLP